MATSEPGGLPLSHKAVFTSCQETPLVLSFRQVLEITKTSLNLTSRSNQCSKYTYGKATWHQSPGMALGLQHHPAPDLVLLGNSIRRKTQNPDFPALFPSLQQLTAQGCPELQARFCCSVAPDGLVSINLPNSLPCPWKPLVST